MSIVERGIRPLESQPKERMSNEELGNLVASVGNHESKAMLMAGLAFMPKGIIDGNYMANYLAAAQVLPLKYQGEDGWCLQANALENYCAQSFMPVGMVEEINLAGERIGFVPTRKGKREGVAVAGSLLDLSQRYDKALIKIFSGTSSQAKEEMITDQSGEFLFKKRAPLNRIMLFRALLAMKRPVRVKDITDAAGIDDAIAVRHLENLREEGIIEKKSPVKEGSKTDFVFAKPVEELPLLGGGYKQLTRDAYSFLEQHPDRTWNLDEFIEGLVQNDSARADQSSLKDGARKVLYMLKREGVVATPNYTSKESTQVWLTDQQRIFLSDLMGILDRIQNRDEEQIAKGISHAKEFILDPQLARDAMLRAKEASHHASVRPSIEMQILIEESLSKFPGSTVEQVRDYLKSTGNDLALPTVRKYLKLLRDNGTAVSEGKVGAVMHWKTINKAS